MSMRCKNVWDREKEAKFTAEYVRSMLDYNPASGIFTWKKRVSQCVRAGDLAGHAARKHWVIKIRGCNFYAHRLAWIIQTGSWPDCLVDHKDRDGCNNKWTNLRLATSAQQAMNSKLYSRNKSGVRGVRVISNGSFKSSLVVKGKSLYLGTFKTLKEAQDVYTQAAIKYHGEEWLNLG